MKTFLISSLVLGLITLPVLSQTDIVRQIRVGNNEGQTRQVKPETIYLSNGHGVTISFLATSETISQAWLDNPSFVVLNADGCLQSFGERNCNDEGDVKVLHLKRINDLNIPGLPPSPQSLLTVITQSQGGKGNVYLFKIVKSAKPSYLVFEITEVENQQEFNNPHQIVQTFRQGLLVAKQQKLLADDSLLDGKINSFLSYLSQGMSVEKASIKADISPDVVNRLQELGQ